MARYILHPISSCDQALNLQRKVKGRQKGQPKNQIMSQWENIYILVIKILHSFSTRTLFVIFYLIS